MLQFFRNSSRSWLGKALTTILFGLLILSFAIWGIADWIMKPSSNVVATVGERKITPQEVREAYLNHVRTLQRQLRTMISPEQAQAMGLDRQVLGQLIGQAILDSGTDELKLAVPDEMIAKIVAREPQFHDAQGNFNREAFNATLQSAGISERDFIKEQRSVLPRRQFAESLSGDIKPILPMQEAFHRFLSERRQVHHITLSKAAAGGIADPDRETLENWFNARKATFRLPEFRTLSVLTLVPENLAKPEEVTAEAALARYEADKEKAYGTPEARHLQQLIFQNEKEAKEAFKRLTADPKADTGKLFEALAAERKISVSDYDLGLVTRGEVFDSAVADAAFSLDKPGISTPVQGKFGTVIIHIASINPPVIQPFNKVEQAVRLKIAIEAARSAASSLYDQIEEERASAKPLSEIAAAHGLTVQTIPAISRNGYNLAGTAVTDLPGGKDLLEAAFSSDIGTDNAPLRQQTSSGLGYVWFDVTDVTPERDQTFDEALEQITAQWKLEALADKLSGIANGIVARLDAGEALEGILASFPKRTFSSSIQSVDNITRNSQAGGLPFAAIQQIFVTHKGKSGTVSLPEGRIIFQVKEVEVPALLPSSEQATAIAEQLHATLADDLIAEYISKRQADLNLTYNEKAFRAAIDTINAGF